MKDNCYSIFETLSNGYPLVDRAASLHILRIESASLFAAKLKGGCAIGEALAVEGEVREKPAPSGSMGKKKGRRDKQRNSPHSHAHPSLLPSRFKLVNNGTSDTTGGWCGSWCWDAVAGGQKRGIWGSATHSLKPEHDEQGIWKLLRDWD